MPEWGAPIKLGQQLQLERCPHCGVHLPSLHRSHFEATNNFRGTNPRIWVMFVCSRCGGVVLAWGRADRNNMDASLVEGTLPQQDELSNEIPATARRYLHQAQESLHAPDGAVMLASSAVDAMLKAKEYLTGSLYSRIKRAAEDHLITADMALWAHHVRLEANDPRHADDEAPHKSPEEAKQAVELAGAPSSGSAIAWLLTSDSRDPFLPSALR